MTEFSTDGRYGAQQVFVVDIGGTYIKVGTDNDKRKPLFIEPTPKSYEAALELISDLSVRTEQAFRPGGTDRRKVVCGSGGLITTEGFCRNALYTPFAGVDIKGELTRRIKGEIMVLNDASLQAYGFLKYAPDSMLISIGTGVGGAIISGGRLLTGANGFAGEIGHFVTGYSDTICRCGRVGCLDTVASGFAFNQILGPDWYHRAGESVSFHLKQLAAAVADTATACSTLLDLNSIIVAGWPARLSEVRQAIRLRLNGSFRKVAFFSNGWSLSVLGTREIIAAHWRNT